MQRRDGFVVRIQIKNERGEVVDETEAISFKGLLALAHEDGLKSVRTKIVQFPSEANQKTAVVTARVKTAKGVFTGSGDASPANVNRKIAPHVLRMAETRALARAFRLAVNIGVVAIEELAEDIAIVGSSEESERGGRHAPRTIRRTEHHSNGRSSPEPADGAAEARIPPERSRGRDDRPTEANPRDRRAMSDDQRRLLFRLAFDLGETKETARQRVLHALGVERLEWATRVEASNAIDVLKREIVSRGDGHHDNA